MRGIDGIAHETTPGLGTSAGTKEDDVWGECSRTNNDGELGDEVGLDECVTRGGDDMHGEETGLDKRAT